MEHHELWIVTLTNKLLGPAVAAALASLGYKVDAAHAIPDYLVMCGIIVVLLTALSLFVRSRLSVENPGKLQILLEDVVGGLIGIMNEYMGPKGARYLPLIGTVGLFIFTANMIGKVPGMMSPTANINVTLGCAVTVWVFYHLMGVREQGLFRYLKHFAVMPGRPDRHRPPGADHRGHQPRVARDVAVAAPVRQHLRRGDGGRDHRLHRALRGAAADDGARRRDRHAAGVHLRAC